MPNDTETKAEEKEEKYLLGRGYLSSLRLNFQFHLWQDALGYNLHPEIKLQDGAKVADVATGTGIWPCAVARDPPPSVHFDGFDVSDAQFPHPASLPKNVTLSTLDAMQDPPESLCGQYDVVHVRLLVAVVDNNDPGPVLRHCVKLLKPGGVLQWDEVDPIAFRLRQCVEGTPTQGLQTLLTMMTRTKEMRWIAQLPESFRRHNLNVLATEAHSEQEHQRSMITELWCLLANEHAAILDSASPEKANQLRQLAAGAHKEIQEGAYVSHMIRVTIGRLSGTS